MRAHAVEEVLRVAHDDEALFVLGQVLLEPHARLEVLFVLGFVLFCCVLGGCSLGVVGFLGGGGVRAGRVAFHAPPKSGTP